MHTLKKSCLKNVNLESFYFVITSMRANGGKVRKCTKYNAQNNRLTPLYRSVESLLQLPLKYNTFPY